MTKNNKVIVLEVETPKVRKGFAQVKPFIRIEEDKTKQIDRKAKHKKPPEMGM